MAKKKGKDSNILFYILIAAAVVVVAFSVYNLVGNNYYGSNYQKAMSAQNPTDICATPEGYTDEAWREHMSHHPDMYAECFK